MDKAYSHPPQTLHQLLASHRQAAATILLLAASSDAGVVVSQALLHHCDTCSWTGMLAQSRKVLCILMFLVIGKTSRAMVALFIPC